MNGLIKRAEEEKVKGANAEWNCATCKHMWSKTEADTLECISCNEGDKYVEYMRGADNEV